MDDYSYGTVYAAWQAELRERAAADALARRVVREARRARRSGSDDHQGVAGVLRLVHGR